MEAPRADARLARDATSGSTRASRLLAWAVLAAAVCLVYGRAVGYPFLRWDDDTAVTQNPFLQPASLSNLARFWSAPRTGLYVPVSFTVFWVETRISGFFHAGPPDPIVFHAGLLILHIACAGIVLRILERLVGDLRAALIGALLFALHPLQVESVAWVTETRGVLATLFGLLALDLYLAGAGRAGGPSLLHHQVPATLCLALALLSKPIAAAVPIAAFLVDRFQLRRPLARILPFLALWCLGTLAVFLVTRAQQPATSVRFEAPPWARPFVALDALAFYLEKLAWPARLAADYGRKPDWLMDQAVFWYHGLVPVAAAGMAALLPGRRAWLLALALFAAGLLPVLGLFSFDFQEISTVGNRYAHLAMIGPAFGLAALVARSRGPVAAALAGALVLALGILAARETRHWRDTEALFTRSLEVNPASVIACVNIGVVRAEAGKLDEAAAWYRRALELDPGYPVAGGNLGRILREQGDLDGAIEVLRATCRAHPEYPYAHQDLAITLSRRGLGSGGEARQRDFDEAEVVLRETVRRQPGFYGGHLTFGQLLLVTGRAREAAAEFTLALGILGNSAEAHHGLALSYAKLGQRELAERHERAARALEPRQSR